MKRGRGEGRESGVKGRRKALEEGREAWEEKGCENARLGFFVLFCV